jgi:hypothetical protein
MKRVTCAAAMAMVLAASAAVNAAQTLQFDLNAFATQARNSGGVNSPFGGLTHTGSVAFSLGSGVLNSVSVSTNGGPFINQGFVGTLTGLSGQINLNNGLVTGGNLLITVNGGSDTYSTSIASVGQVSTYVGGGFKIEGLTVNGVFSDALFGNVNVSNWFNQTLAGSFLQFNFSPDANGAANADMDVFVTVVPLPPASFAGLATLCGLFVWRRARNKSS